MNSRWKVYVALHVMLMVYSMSGIFSKMAAGKEFLSVPFMLFYGVVIALLGTVVALILRKRFIARTYCVN